MIVIFSKEGVFHMRRLFILPMLFCILLFLISGRTPAAIPYGNATDESGDTDNTQYMPPDLTLEEQALNQLVVEGITTDYRIVDDANTQKIVKSFFQQLEPVAFPVTKDEYEKAAFINGYIQMEFETGDGVYAIHGDNPSTILVSFSNGGDNESCYGIYSVTTEAFESVVSYLYEYSETADVNDDATKPKRSVSWILSAEYRTDPLHIPIRKESPFYLSRRSHIHARGLCNRHARIISGAALREEPCLSKALPIFVNRPA